MYVPAHAREERPQVLYEAIERIRFGSLATYHGGRLYITHLPMMADPSRAIVRGHVARGNAQWQGATHSQAVASFVGPHYYVSPSEYATKAQTGKVVPTWNYIAVEARGPIEFFDARDRLLELVTDLTQRQEAGRAQPWHVDDAPPEYIENQLRGIVGFQIAVDELIGAWKLSRNRDDADRAGVADAMERSGDPAVRALADTVRHGREL